MRVHGVSWLTSCTVGIPGATLRDLFGSFSADFMADGRMPADEPDRDWGDAPSRAA